MPEEIQDKEYESKPEDVDALVDTIVNSRSIPDVVEAVNKLIEESRKTRNLAGGLER